MIKMFSHMFYTSVPVLAAACPNILRGDCEPFEVAGYCQEGKRVTKGVSG